MTLTLKVAGLAKTYGWHCDKGEGAKISKILCARRPQRALMWLLVKLVLAVAYPVAYQLCLNFPCIIPAATSEPLAGR